MKAAVMHEARKPLVIEEVPISKPGPREVLIRTAAVGVCHSDLHFFDGVFSHPLPTILGHEAAGVVEAVGRDVRAVKAGDHVITCLSAYCGHCELCLTGHLALCQSQEMARDAGEAPRLGSGQSPVSQYLNLSSFAEMMLVHEHACVAIRKDMPLDRAALIGCAVTTGTGAVFNTAGLRPGETVAVIGCGGIGLSAINGAAVAGASRIIAVDRVPEKLALARAFGATDTLEAGDDLAKQVTELTGGGVHHAIEAVGLKKTAEQAFYMLRPAGTATLIGVMPPSVKLELKASYFMFERKIQGSRMGSNRFPVDIPRLVELYLQGKLKLDALISQRISLSEVNEAMEELRGGNLARSVIMFS